MTSSPAEKTPTGNNRGRPNRFQVFFEQTTYLVLKNYLYNYLLRKRAIEKAFCNERPSRILEVGSGISPSITDTDRIVYLDLSPLALQTLRGFHERGWYVAAKCEHLPFKDAAFSHTICAEVLEHIEDDRAGVRELARVTTRGGRVIVSFPHRKFYFANDDRFVHHCRRYELDEMVDRLRAEGLNTAVIRKILGPLDKATMCIAVLCFEALQRMKPAQGRGPRARWVIWVLAFLFKWLNRLYAPLVWLDAQVVPRALATQLLIKAEKQ